MKLPDDDELYEVDQTYLGPPKRYIGEMRYRTIFAFIVIAPVTMVVLRQIGMPLTLLTTGLWLLFSTWASMKVSDHVGYESSVIDWWKTFQHELTTPRPSATTARATSGTAFRRIASPSRVWSSIQARRERPTTATTTGRSA